MRTLLILLLIYSVNYINAQNNFRQNKYCENTNTPLDMILVENKKVEYQIVAIASLKTLKNEDGYAVDCILPAYTSKSNNEEMKKIASQLRKLNPQFLEFTFFNSCEVYKIYLSSTYPTSEQEKKISNGYIGNFKLDN